MGMYTALGNMGNIAGTYFYPANEAPTFREGHWLSFSMAVATAVISIANSLTLRAVNKRRDKLYGKPLRQPPMWLRRARTGRAWARRQRKSWTATSTH